MSKMEIIHENRPSQFFVLSDGAIYQLKWDDSRLTTHIKDIKDISKTDYEVYLTGDRTGSDLMFKAAYGIWHLPKAESDRCWIIKCPWTLIDDVEKQKLFSQEELRELFPKSEEDYKRRHQGKLPENYTRPILD